MFDWVCISVALALALTSSVEYRAVCFIILFEFIFHKVAYIAGIQLTEYLEYARIYAAYSIIELSAIYVLSLTNAPKLLLILIFINLGYNLATLSQYSLNTYDFHTYYKYFVGSIMVLEILIIIRLSNAGVVRRSRKLDASGVRSNLFLPRRLPSRFQDGCQK